MGHVRRARSLLQTVVVLCCAISVTECQLDFQVEQTFHGINILCSVGDLQSTSFSHLESLLIVKSVAGKRQILASMSSHYGHNDPVSHVIDAQVTGQLSNEDFGGYLRITWSHSGADLDGDYICDLNGEDADFVPLTLTQELSVQVQTMCPCFGTTPDVLRVGLTTEFEAVCYIPNPAAINISRLASLEIIIIRNGMKEILAEINSLTGIPIYEGPGDGFANGSLGGINTFLSAVLEYPTADMAAEYICEGSGVGISGDPVFFSKHVNVSLEVPDSEELIQRLFEMYEVQKELKRCQEERDRLSNTSPATAAQTTTSAQTIKTAQTTKTTQTTTSPQTIKTAQTTTSAQTIKTAQTTKTTQTTTSPQTIKTAQTTTSAQTIKTAQTTKTTQTTTSPQTIKTAQTTKTAHTTTSPQTIKTVQTTTSPQTIKTAQTTKTTQTTTNPPTTPKSMFPRRCDDANLPIGQNVIIVQPDDGLGTIAVLCEVTTSQEVWTVFQKRYDGSVSFYHGLTEYRNGFGNAYGEFWLGLDNLRRLLLQNNDDNQLQFNLQEYASTTTYTKTYPTFSIGPGDSYILNVSGGADDGGLGLSPCFGQGFSTYDHGYSTVADIKAGGWWFPPTGGYVNINGIWGSIDTSQAMNWYEFRHSWAYPMGKTQMKFRRNP